MKKHKQMLISFLFMLLFVQSAMYFSGFQLPVKPQNNMCQTVCPSREEDKSVLDQGKTGESFSDRFYSEFFLRRKFRRGKKLLGRKGLAMFLQTGKAGFAGCSASAPCRRVCIIISI